MQVAIEECLALRIIVDSPWTAAHRRSTVHSSLNWTSNLFSLVSGEKADNYINFLL